ncbi:MAG: alpha/beta fold hydrolase [archaeon]
MAKKVFFTKKKLMIALGIFVFLLILAFLGFKLFLYVKYLIGNDLVIQVDSSTRDLSLAYGENANVSFKMSKITSPLCTTECEYSFLDVSKNQSINGGNISIGQISLGKEQTLTVNKLGSGQEMYRFTLSCRNLETFICHTTGLPVSRDVLITLEYGPNEAQNNATNALAEKVYSSFNSISRINSNLVYLRSQIDSLNGTIRLDYDFNNLTYFSSSILTNLSKVNLPWQNYDYPAIDEILNSLNYSQAHLIENFNSLNLKINGDLEIYNSLVNNLSIFNSRLVILSRGINQSDLPAFNRMVLDFNAVLNNFTKYSSPSAKADIVSSLNYSSLSIGSLQVNYTSEFNLSKIELNLPNTNSSFILNSPTPSCCVYGVCKQCGQVPGNYPILFVHGHDFSQGISAEYSLNTFKDIQDALDGQGFLNAGQLTLYDQLSNISGRLGRSGVPVTLRTTYYYDVFKESSLIYLPVQVKSENLDSYAIKLKTLVDKLKYETRQPKIIIVAHSMGGLVSRRYLQLFGNESVDKLIMMATPNNGIAGNTLSICPLFGAQAECNDLAQGSLFLNKLNTDFSPSVPTYNIIGTGCSMDLGDGDGVVLAENARLSGAQEFYVNGTCSGVDLLHLNILETNTHPEVVRVLKSILSN